MTNYECRMTNGILLESLSCGSTVVFIVPFGIQLDGRQNLDQLTGFIEKGIHGALEARIRMNEQSQPIAGFACFFPRDSDVGPEVGLALSGVRLLQIGTDRRPRAQQLSGELANDPTGRHDRFAEVDDLRSEKK